MPPAFNTGLEGAAAGSDLQFSVSYPQGHETEELAAKTVAYRLHVHEVKRRVLENRYRELIDSMYKAAEKAHVA